MMHRTSKPVMMHCGWNQANNCHTVPTIVSFSRRLYPSTLSNYLPDNQQSRSHDSWYLGRQNQTHLSTYRMILIVRTHKLVFCLSFLKESSGRNNNPPHRVNKHWYLLWLASRLPTVGGSGQVASTDTRIPSSLRVTSSGECLSSTQVVGIEV